MDTTTGGVTAIGPSTHSQPKLVNPSAALSPMFMPTGPSVSAQGPDSSFLDATPGASWHPPQYPCSPGWSVATSDDADESHSKIKYREIFEHYHSMRPDGSCKQFDLYYAEFGQLLNCTPNIESAMFRFLWSESCFFQQNTDIYGEPVNGKLALDIVQGFQKSSPGPNLRAVGVVIKECQFALGDSSGKRTFATKVLRVLGARVMLDKKGPLTHGQYSEVLQDARKVLDDMFSGEEGCGEMFFQGTKGIGKRLTER